MIVDFSLEITKTIRYNGVTGLFNPFIFFSCVVCTIISSIYLISFLFVYRNLALGIGIQNFPEGLAVSLPLQAAGFSVWRAFW